MSSHFNPPRPTLRWALQCRTRRSASPTSRIAGVLLALGTLGQHVASPAGATSAAAVGACARTVAEQVIVADPTNYRDGRLAALAPGDWVVLAAGTYTQGLPLTGVHGEADRCIVIEGPATGAPALFTGRACCNTVELTDTSYLVVRNLELDGLGIANIDAVKATAGAASHHVTLEGLWIHGHDGNQQTVGISTKGEAWNWVIRHNRITGAGTGMYLGDSTGEAEFVGGLIEHNLVLDTVGYNLQIKHQNNRSVELGMPADAQTIIRHNVFSKANNASTGGDARPNLLVGHWPLTGAGSGDLYSIYGNFFWQNPSGEPLFQAEGNLAFYDNLLVNHGGPAVWIQPHEDVPKRVHVFHNTVLAQDEGIRISGGDAGFAQRVIANAVFAATPVSGGSQASNTTGPLGDAALHLVNPAGVLLGTGNRLDLSPLTGALGGGATDLSAEAPLLMAGYDFDTRWRAAGQRGGYGRSGTAPAWQLALTVKPPGAVFTDGFESAGTTSWSAAEL